MKRKQKRGEKLLGEKAERHLSDMSPLPAQIPSLISCFHIIWVHTRPIPGACTHLHLPQYGSGSQEGSSGFTLLWQPHPFSTSSEGVAENGTPGMRALCCLYPGSMYKSLQGFYCPFLRNSLPLNKKSAHMNNSICSTNPTLCF